MISFNFYEDFLKHVQLSKLTNDVSLHLLELALSMGSKLPLELEG